MPQDPRDRPPDQPVHDLGDRVGDDDDDESSDEDDD